MISVEDLKIEFNGKVVLDIDKLDFCLGKRYALIGLNGSGKSTLLKTLAKVIKPAQGNIELDGNKIGYMPQDSMGFSMSVWSNIKLCLKNEDEEKANELLDFFNMASLKKKNASRLSGGETQKLALIRILLRDFDVLLLDEPTSSMDSSSVKKAEEAINNYLSDGGKTFVFSTHSVNQAKRLADEYIFLDGGKVCDFGNIEKLENSQNEKLKSYLNN